MLIEIEVSYILFQLILIFSGFYLILYLLLKDSRNIQIPSIHPILNIPLNIFVILFIALFPKKNSADKQTYSLMFNQINEISIAKDYGWYYYMRFCRLLFDNELLFFLLTSILYFTGYYIFFKSLIQKRYLFYILLTTFGSLGFLAYGINTIRAGLALSFLLFAFSKKNNKILFILFMTIAFFIHKSMVILIIGFFITGFIKNSKKYIYGWFLFLVISATNLGIVTYFSDMFFSFDERVGQYMNLETNELYLSAGFRIDFIIYSFIPIIFGYYYIFKLKFKDVVYSRLFNLYIFTNSFWLLVIRVPFADRFAYLSWFLLPFLMLYPLLSSQKINNRRIKLAVNILLIIGINLILLIKKHL